MRSADGLDACFALSTACPYAVRGRVSAAAARPHVARNERRPVVAVIVLLLALFDLEDEHTASGFRRRTFVHGTGGHENRLGRPRRCRPIEDQFDGILDVAMPRRRSTRRDRPRVSPLVLPRWRAED